MTEIESLQKEVEDLQMKNAQLTNQFIDSNTRLNESQELSQIGSWSWDLKTNEIVWSDTMFLLMGIKPGAVTPSYELALNHVHEGDKVEYEKKLKFALDNKIEYFLENKIRKTNNDVASVISRGKCFLDSQGELEKMIGTVQDISERNKMVESNIKLERLVKMLSYDIKGPVNSIIGFSELLKQVDTDKLTTNENKYLRYLNAAANELNKYINQILDESNTEQNGLSYSRIESKLFLDGIWHSITSNTTANHVQIGYQNLPDFFSADRNKMKQVFQIILVNVLEYTQSAKNPKISIEYQSKNEMHEFKVTDNSELVGKRYLNVVNEKRGDLEIKESELGIGLFVCENILHQHQGEIWAHSDGSNENSIIIRFSKHLE